MKWCNRGQHFVEIVGFGKQSRAKDGLQSTCRPCRAAYLAENHEQINARRKAYRDQNKEKIKSQYARYYERHRTAHNARCRDYASRHPEKIREINRAKYGRAKEEWKQRARSYYYANHASNKEKQRAYYRRNKERYKLAARLRKARVKGAPGWFSIDQWNQKVAFFGGRCYLCRNPLVSGDIHVEHRIPISRGGTNWIANIAPACGRCNLQKSDKTEREYFNWLQSLS